MPEENVRYRSSWILWTAKAAQKVAWTLSLLEDIELLPTSIFKKLTGSADIWEVRASLGSNIFRIFCFFAGDAVVVLTHGFAKKRQKTPRKEIERAEIYRREYLGRRQ